jgi:hypothetical protein
MLARVEAIRNSSSDCGEYTDEQTEELAELCVALVGSFQGAIQALENECDRLRDGPSSMVEGDYIYYRDQSVVPLKKGETMVRIQSLNAEGKLRFIEVRGSAQDVERRLLAIASDSRDEVNHGKK